MKKRFSPPRLLLLTLPVRTPRQARAPAPANGGPAPTGAPLDGGASLLLLGGGGYALRMRR